MIFNLIFRKLWTNLLKFTTDRFVFAIHTRTNIDSSQDMRSKGTTLLIWIIAMLSVAILGGCNFSEKKEITQNLAKENNSYKTDELTIQKGMAIFNQHCASCHNFNATEIGPSLGGITSEVDKAWLKRFINNPKEVTERGDERAVELFEKYKMYMPAFTNIDSTDMEHLLGFMHKFSEGEKKSKKKRSGGLLNPIPEKIPESNLTLIIKELLTIPPSAESSLQTRINKLVTIETELGERLFIADLRGKLHEIVENEQHVYMDLKELLENFIDNPGRASGFGSFDFHPEFENNGLFYTTHTEPAKTVKADFAIPDSIRTTLQWVLTEWKADDPTSQTFAGGKREILRADMVSGAHGFQEVTFNPLAKSGDAEYGLLYLGIGDGSAALAGHPYLCDNPGKIWGSVIRIDPLGNDSVNGNYGVPKDNPYVGEKNKLAEVWCHGFRNPHRISWSERGRMFITNIGQHSIEEVNLGKKGANYGWPNREGTFLFDVDANIELVYPIPTKDYGYTYPVIQYDHDEGNAISGGFVYSGTKIPLLGNKYIFGDITRGTLFYSEASEITQGTQAPIFKMNLKIDGLLTSLGSIATNERVDLRFGKDSSGELFIFTKGNGKVYRVIGCETVSL